jgi:DNA-binding CsgD family transcriptional regulator
VAGKTVTQNGKLAEKPELSIDELQQRCRACFVTNPLACKEICGLWKLKQEYLALRKDLPDRPDTTTVLAAATNQTNLKVLRLLDQGPSDPESLRIQLGSATAIDIGQVLKALVEAGLARVEDEIYHVTTAGRKTLDLLEHHPSLELEEIDARDEKVVQLLAQGAKTLDELNKEIPRNELMRALEHLRIRGVVEKTSGNQVLYFATKRRPTRRLAPTELAIFKSLPKQGISPQELSKKLDLTLPSVYRYLRLLRYKRHAIRRKQAMTFQLTPIGLQIADALEKVAMVIQSLSRSDFA